MHLTEGDEMLAKLRLGCRDGVGWLVYKIVRFLLLAIVKVKRVDLTIVGTERLPKKGAYVLALVPHTSFVDGPLIIMAVRRRFIGVGMAELLSWKEWHFISLLFRLMGHIPVQRDDPQSRKVAFEAGIMNLQRGVPVFISPPGRIRSPEERDVWRSGYARLAKEAGVPMALARVFGAKGFMDEGPEGEWVFDWQKPISVVIGAVLDPNDFASADELDAEAQRIYDTIQPPD